MDEFSMVVSVVGLVIASITLGFKIAKEIYHDRLPYQRQAIIFVKS